MKKVFLSKRSGLIALALLLLLDTVFDILRGTQGNQLWKPIENAFGIWVFPLLVPVALVLFYLAIKAMGWLVYRIDKTPHAEEILLTVFVIIFVVHDLWVFSSDYLGFRLIKSFYHMIPIYIIIGLSYALWAEHALKK
ncbi:MAG: hypothetical protein HZB67_00050 [Candidatus Aenigmarchaeota archaeon]|nr:hypothetical protein [Candidatus Aenigmarchaeota archaeon]